MMLSFSIVVHEYIKSIEGSPDLFEKLAKSDYKKNKDVSLLGSNNSFLCCSTKLARKKRSLFAVPLRA